VESEIIQYNFHYGGYMKKFFTLVIICISLEGFTLGQGNKIFTIPLENLKEWSQSIIVTMNNVTITGNSGVHKLENDCELHFGASIEGYRGDPSGLVMEPMNVCEEPFFGKTKQVDKNWTDFAKSLKNKKVTAEGVPRIWPEHLEGEGTSSSNPNHALEIHPLTKLKTADKTYDFSKFVYAPNGYWGGVSPESAEKIIKKIEVGVTTNNDMVEIDFEAGLIGNFTTLELEFNKDSIHSITGGHFAEGNIITDQSGKVPAWFITADGSPIDKRMEKWKNQKRKTIAIDALALFSLSPGALYKAATESDGSRIVVDKPIQLIIYGISHD
jgi:hypothetical protein